jgi:hypothetical protein
MPPKKFGPSFNFVGTNPVQQGKDKVEIEAIQKFTKLR